MSFEALLVPISDVAPAGEDCAGLLEFENVSTLSKWLAESALQVELERESIADPDAYAKAKKAGETTLQAGQKQLEALSSSVKPLLNKTPSNSNVRLDLVTRSEGLLKTRGKDLRIVAGLARAWSGERGLMGLADAFELAEALLTQFKASLHPMPDEDEDPDDFSGRAIVLAELFNGIGLVAILRDVVLIPANSAGRLSIRDIEVIDQLLPPDRSDGARSVEQIHAVALVAKRNDGAAAQALLNELIAIVDRCLAGAARVSAHFNPGTIRGDRVLVLLNRIKARLGAAVATGPDGDAAQGAVDSTSSRDGEDLPSAGAGGQGAFKTGGTMSRSEARRLILEISSFIEKTEPSHPAPLLLRRAEKLLGAKDFFEIVRNMTPDGMRQLEDIAGRKDEPGENGNR